MKNYSQNNEQQVILDYFSHKGITCGKCLEIGAFDGENFSNTRALMLSGWSGVFVEPSAFSFTKLFEMYKMYPRKAELINLAVVPEDQLDGSPLLVFHEAPHSAVSSSMRDHTTLRFKEINEDGDMVNPRKVYVAKIGMKEILNKFGPFDMINIDVEGYSANLAMQDWFDPREYGCKLLCIEADWKHKEVYERFATQGYRLLHNNAENIILVLP